MDELLHKKLSREIGIRLRNEIRDVIISEMNVDDVIVDNVATFINKCTLEQLLEFKRISEILDWQYIGRVIGVVVESGITPMIDE
jgi:hypothetical protein